MVQTPEEVSGAGETLSVQQEMAERAKKGGWYGLYLATRADLLESGIEESDVRVETTRTKLTDTREVTVPSENMN